MASVKLATSVSMQLAQRVLDRAKQENETPCHLIARLLEGYVAERKDQPDRRKQGR